MTDASTRFASLPELVRCLAEQIPNRKRLITLSLVNRTFHAAVTPFVHRELHIRNSAQLRECLAYPVRLAHARSLSVVHDNYYGASQDHALYEVLLQALPSMSRLEHFKIDSATRWYSEEGKPPLPVAVLSTLRESCPGIKALEVAFHDKTGSMIGYSDLVQPEGWRLQERLLCGKPDVTVFLGLQELALENLYEELPWWKAQVIQVLKSSPRLRRLKLSLSADTLFRYDADDERDKFEDFFGRLCDDYGEAGAAPLRLRSLYLGTGLYPHNVDSVKKLTDLVHLEEVHVGNAGVWHNGKLVIDMYNNDDEDSGIAFDVFGPAHCPNLRRYTLDSYQRDVHDFFATADPSWVRRLLVFSRSTWGDYGYEPAALLRPDPRYPSLPVHPRMIYANLDRARMRLLDEDGRPGQRGHTLSRAGARGSGRRG